MNQIISDRDLEDYYDGVGTLTITIEGFPQSCVPDVRDWLDLHDLDDADVTFTETEVEE